MPHHPAKTSVLLTMLYMLLVGLTAPCLAQDTEDLQVLRLFYNDNDLVSSATRSEKPLSQVAENMTIITATDIKAMNAHTVADVLNTITGLQVANSMGPGSLSNVMIQGSNSRHVLVMIDGVTQNNLSDMFPDVGALRVQHIARIEIIKGPGSSAWGSSLGGVINIITKAPDEAQPATGIVTAAIGERTTGDYRAELSGTVNSFGYYLSGGGLMTDGLLQNSAVDSGNVYGKFRWQPTRKSSVMLTLSYDEGSRGLSEIPTLISFSDQYRYFFSTASLNHKFSENLTVDLSLRGSLKDNTISYRGIMNFDLSGEDSSIGGSARLNWKAGRNNLIIGSDFDLGSMESLSVLNGSQDLDKWALYVNDTITLGSFSLTPGLRYDNTSTNGDFISPSLGATCAIAESTIIRAYIARGFNIPPLSYTFAVLPGSNPDLKMEKIWSYSAGIESAALPYLWLKATYFRHDISDAMILTQTSIINVDQRREGVEFEFKTTPIFNVSLTGGFTFINAKDQTNGEVIKNIPRYVYDLGIQYENEKQFRALLKGRKIDWNTGSSLYSKYSAMTWDLNLSKKFNLSETIAAEAFFTAHNLFNGAQYIDDYFKNPRRWFEGGLRFAF
jgi:vitamin B12 transporter